jgi:hypothetical protein
VPAQNAFGVQVDAWGALLMGRGNLASQIEEETIKNVESKGLEGLKVEKRDVALEGMGEAREHVVFSQSLPRAGVATVAMRVAQKGAEDLELSWRLFETNVIKSAGQAGSQGLLLLLGIGFIVVGIPLSIFGVGLIGVCLGVICLLMAFFLWVTSRGKTTASAFGQFDSRVLAQNVDYALMKALASSGVAAQELRVLQKGNMGGLGNLASSSPLDSIPPPRLPI